MASCLPSGPVASSNQGHGGLLAGLPQKGPYPGAPGTEPAAWGQAER